VQRSAGRLNEQLIIGKQKKRLHEGRRDDQQEGFSPSAARQYRAV